MIVALVGSGQEINRGEAGLSEWGRAISARFRHWEVFVSPELKAGIHSTGACLFPETPEGIEITEDASLHLSVNLRSYKAEVLSEFVDAVLRLEPERARALTTRLGDFPIVLTRDFPGRRNGCEDTDAVIVGSVSSRAAARGASGPTASTSRRTSTWRIGS